MEYRINYGNGQVSKTFHSYAAVRAEIIADHEYAVRHRQPYSALMFIQRYEGAGEWFFIGKKAGRPHIK